MVLPSSEQSGGSLVISSHCSHLDNPQIFSIEAKALVSQAEIMKIGNTTSWKQYHLAAQSLSLLSQSGEIDKSYTLANCLKMNDYSSHSYLLDIGQTEYVTQF